MLPGLIIVHDQWLGADERLSSQALARPHVRRQLSGRHVPVPRSTQQPNLFVPAIERATVRPDQGDGVTQDLLEQMIRRGRLASDGGRGIMQRQKAARLALIAALALTECLSRDL